MKTEAKVVKPTCTNGHYLDSLSVKPSYYTGRVECDTCGRVIKEKEKFQHCKICKQDYCNDCKYEKLLQQTLSQHNSPSTMLPFKKDEDEVV